MRTPHADRLPKADRLKLLALDGTKRPSIVPDIAAAGHIDIVVDIAGIGVASAFAGHGAGCIRSQHLWRHGHDAGLHPAVP